MSQLEVDKIIPQSGTTLTIGDSGDTITVNGNASLTTSGPNGLVINQRTDNSGVSANIFLSDSSGTVGIQSNIGALRFNTDATVGSASGTQRMRIVSGGDISFYEDTGTTPKFFWDASEESLGIGTTSPVGRLNIATASTDGVNTVFGTFASPNDAGMYVGFNDSEATATLGVYYSASPKPMINITRSDGTIKFMNDTTERMRIDSSGNVGIGTASVDLTSAGRTVLQIEGSSNALVNITDGTSRLYLHQKGGTSGADIWNSANSYMRFATNDAERMRIDSSGNLLVGCTSVPNVGVSGQYGTTSSSTEVVISKNTSGTNPALYIRTSGGASKTAIIFYNDTTPVGSITTTTSSTAYNTSSDYRLKENVVDITGATERLKQLQPKRFNFIADADTTVDGFLAHEVSDIVPEAITGTKDEVDADGNPVYQNIDHSKLVPLLTSALQEAIAKIETLEVRLNALES